VISHAGSLLLEDDGAVVAATHVIARLLVPEALALVLMGGQGETVAVDESPPAACDEAASATPGTATHACGLYKDSLLVPAVAAMR